MKEAKRAADEEKAKQCLHEKLEGQASPQDQLWAKFLPAWDIEKLHYPTETQQLQVLREATVDKIDKAIIDNLTSVAEVMSHFYSRYGTQEAVAKRVLNNLELLPPHSDTSLEEENLVKCSGALDIWQQQKSMDTRQSG